ncbi:MAG: hypothetical protein FWG46_07490 [Treponema sp.]|nr:hypothetical protein [Treponema sp.]
MKKIFILMILLSFAALSLFAQTAAEMDALLETRAVSGGAAARFVLEAAELLPPGLSGAEAESAAFDLAKSRGWLNGAAADPVSLRDTAFLVMGAFDFGGGLMYTLFHNPRYAYREMVHRKLIQGRADPSMAVSGARLLHIIGRTLSWSGEDERLDAARAGGAAQ